MKKYFYSAIAASMLFACSQEEIVDVTGGESQMKTFKVEIPQVESRTVGGITLGAGTQADALIYAMYENGGDETTPLISGVVYDGQGDENDGIFTVTVPMAKDLKYDLLFLAYNETNTAFEIASDAKTTNLKELKFKADQTANIDAFDAFTGALKAQGINDANEVTLKRPFAQINAATSKTDMDNAKTLKLNVTQSKLVIKGVPQYYNVLEAAASGSVDVTYAASAIMECDGPNASNQAYPNEMIEVDGTNYYYLTLAYVLAGEVTTTSTHNATFEFQRENGQSVSTLEIVSLPIQRNYRTNVIGDLLTKSEEYTITIDANFGPNDDQAHVVGVWDGTTDKDGVTPDNENIYKIYNGSELAWIAEQVDGGNSFADKTVMLMNDIDLGNIAWNPIGTTGDAQGFKGTFEGNGKTISNLFVDLTEAKSSQAAGLFATANGATIKNFTIQNAVVKNMTTLSTSGTAVVLGSSQFGATISGVNVKNAVVESNRLVAGIVGYFNGTVENCSVDGIELTATPDDLDGNGIYDNGDKVGGIIANHNSHVSSLTQNNIVNNFKIRAYRDMGGIIGGGRGSFTNNKAMNGEIIVDQLVAPYFEAPKNANAGEIVGRNLAATIDNTDNFENVTIITLTAQNYVTSQASFDAALSAGDKIYLGKNTASRATTADYTWKVASKSFEIIAVEEGVVIDMNCVDRQSLGAANITASFEGVTLYYNGVEYSGFHHSISETYTDCIIEGYLKSYAPVVKFTDCVFNQTKDDSYSLNMYGAGSMTITDCEFNGTGKGMFAYNEGPGEFNITITDTDFKANKTQSGKAAIQMHTEDGIYGTLTLNNVTAEGFDSSINGGLYNELNNTANPKYTTHKFVKIIDGKKTVGTADALKAAITAAKDGDVIYLADGEYIMPEPNFEKKALTFKGSKDTKIDVSNVDTRNQFVTGATLVFDGVTLKFNGSDPNKLYMGFANTKSLTYTNCNITGLQILNGEKVTFENCVLDSQDNTMGQPHSVWTYGAKNVSFTECTFKYGHRAVNCYKDEDIEGGKQVVNFKDCIFITEDTNSEGAVEINSSAFSVGIEVNMESCTAPAYGPIAYVSPWDKTSGAKTTINIK